MFLRLSILSIVALAGSALAATGYVALKAATAAPGIGPLERLVATLPPEAAFAAPVAAAALVASALVVLRVLGFLITLAFTAGATATALAVGLHREMPQIVETLRAAASQ
ncbi:MAG: hypothetical protein GC150_06120 [Rhizobiales bacterium]|nr:hypothetical protein [Hyphomicrobiales bacterium]